jgi:hypothetical protein
MEINNSGTTGGIMSWVTDKVYALADGIIELADNTKLDWKQYTLSNISLLNDTWDSVVVKHSNLMKNRTLLGFDKFDPPVESIASKSSLIDTWTEEDEKYLTGVYELVNRIVKYGYQLQNNMRDIAWDEVLKDVAILGTPDEPIIIPTSTGNLAAINWDKQDSDKVINTSYISGAPIAAGTIVLVVAITIGTVLAVNKICDTIRDHISRAEARDMRRQQDRIYEDARKSGKSVEESVSLAKGLTEATANAIASQEKARAELRGAGNEEISSTIKTVSWLAFGVIAIGGTIWAVNKFSSGSERSSSRLLTA